MCDFIRGYLDLVLTRNVKDKERKVIYSFEIDQADKKNDFCKV